MERDEAASTKRRRLATIAAIALGATALLVGVAAIVGRDDGDDVDSVLLDEPGEYQQPGIGTNRDLEGQSLDASEVEDAGGNTVSTAEWSSSGRPLVINVWYSTCRPCKREMPVLQSAFETFGDRVDFFGVNPQDTQSRMIEFAADLGVSYELFRDPDGRFTVANGIAAFPTTLFVDTEGQVVEQIAGELSADELQEALTRLVQA